MEYQKNTLKCYSVMKQFKKKHKFPIISDKKLVEVLLDIEAIRNNNYDVIEKENE